MTKLHVPVARPVIGEAEISAAVRVLRSGQVVQGAEVADFESEFSAIVDHRHCIAVNSGTSALHLALSALGIGRNDEVILPSFSFAATGNAVRLAGADPVFVDIDPRTFCLDAESAAHAVSGRTAAIMPVHLYGHPADMDGIVALAKRHGLAIIEDAAQAHGAALHGTPVGTFGDAAAFSFYPTKNMHSLEGGMVTTSEPVVARTFRLLRNQGMEQQYCNEIVGHNMRMTDVAAAVGREQLKRLNEWNEQRRAHAKALDAGLDGLEGIRLPFQADGAHHVYHQYTVRVGHGMRDALRDELTQRGIGTAVHYPTPIHRLASFQLEAELPNTDQAAAEVLSLPVHPSLTAGELERIISEVHDAMTAVRERAR